MRIKENKAVTLIALVITIIVLLIIAVIALNLTLGENGIVKRAKQATEENDKQAALEEIKLIVADVQAEKKLTATLLDVVNKLNEVNSSVYTIRLGAVAKLADEGIISDTINNLSAIYVTNITKYNYEIKITNKFEISLAEKGYKIEYNANGGTIGSMEDTTALEGNPVKVSINKYKKANYYFVNWNTKQDGSGTSYKSGQEIVLNSNMMLYAQWGEKQISAGETASGTNKIYVDKNGDKAMIFPGMAVSTVEGESTLEDGLVVKYGNDEFVWIEVPNDGSGPDYSEVSSSTDYEKIRIALINYAAVYRKNADSKDHWFEYKTVSQTSTTLSMDPLTGDKYANGKKTSMDMDLTNSKHCGLTYEDYQIYYKAMLKSIYENGGFYIGRYEAGIEGSTTEEVDTSTYISDYARTSGTEITSSSPSAISQQNAIPYNFLCVKDAQFLASAVVTSNETYRSSLLFGIQWDLVMKHLEVRLGLKESDLRILQTDSTSWGNYSKVGFALDRGRYSYSKKGFQYWYPNTVDTYYTVSSSSKKAATGAIGEYAALLTTGAADRNCKKNIYDLSGNVCEYTLESGENAGYIVTRGSNYTKKDTYNIGVSYRQVSNYYVSSAYIGFRVSIY